MGRKGMLNCPAPLGRGALTGTLKSPEDIPKGDFRCSIPRFQGENFETNAKLGKEVEKLAREKACTPAQISIGWLLALSRRPGLPKIIPIPGTSKVERIRENAKEVELTDDDMAAIDKILAEFPVVGERYGEAAMALLDE
jgi:pyridoxine 4-dehydrogenase